MAGVHPEVDQQNNRDAGVTDQKLIPPDGNIATPQFLGIGDSTIQSQDMYVVLSDRIMQPTYPQDEEKDLNKPPPGCPCDKETWKISYDDLVETTKKANPEWTSRQVKVKSALQFRPMFRSDKASIKKERSGEKKYDSDATFTVTDNGKLVYTSGGYEGVEIEDFHLRQKRLTPDKYSLRDHQTSLAIQETFRNGEVRKHKKTTVVTSYYREGADNRDILVMEYNHETKTGTIRVVNTEEGTYHDFSTITAIAKQEFPTFHETRPTDGIFLLTDNEVPQDQIRRAVLSVERDEVRKVEVRVTSDMDTSRQPMRADEMEERRGVGGQQTTAKGEATPLPQRHEKGTVSDAIVGDTMQTVDYVRRSLQREFEILTTTLWLNADQEIQKKPIVLPPFLQQPFGISEERKSKEERVQNRQLHEKGERDLADRQSERGLEIVQEVWETIVGAQEVIAFAADPKTEGVAIPAALLALDMLAHPVEPPLAQEFTKNESIHWKWNWNEESDNTVSLASMQVKQEQEQSSDSERIDFTVLVWVKEFIQRIDREPIEQATETIKHEEEVTLITMSNLWEMVAYIRELKFTSTTKQRRLTSADTNSNSELKLAPSQDVEITEKIEHEHVENFSFVFTIWLLLKLDNYYRSLHSLKVFFKKEPKRGGSIEKLKKRTPEGIVQQELSQWILLSIIWHLAMIREQGLRNYPINQLSNTTNNQIKKRKQRFALREGVIFVFAPVPEHSSVRDFAVALAS